MLAAALAQQAIPVKQEILALYDGAQEGDADFTRIHRLAEMPLNHLGFILRFHDIRAKLPEPVEIERYRGVLTWFVGSVSDSNVYLAWANQVSQMNVRYVILGDVGIAINPTNILAVNQFVGFGRSPTFRRICRTDARDPRGAEERGFHRVRMLRLDLCSARLPRHQCKWGRHADRSDARNATP